MKPALRLTRGGIIASIGVFIVALVCVRLGLWQLDRLAERRARNTQIEARMSGVARTLHSAPSDTTGLIYRRVTLHGAFDHERSVLLTGRSRRATPGVHLWTPLRMGDGAVLVERGWLPSVDAATVDLDAYAVAGDTTVSGIVLPLATTQETPRDPSHQRLWFMTDDEIASQLPYDAPPIYVRILGDEHTAELPRPIGAPELDEGSHFSYAIQWFSFALIAIVGWLVLVLRSGAVTGRATS